MKTKDFVTAIVNKANEILGSTKNSGPSADKQTKEGKESTAKTIADMANKILSSR